MLFYIVIGIVIYILLKILYFDGVKTKKEKDMTGKVIIITGASSGIGRVTAQTLLKNGAEVIFASRDEDKINSIINGLEENQKKRAYFLFIELSSIESVIQFVTNVKKQFSKIDILINNAGAHPERFELTKNGIERYTQGNHIGHMLLSFLLLEHFDEKEGKIINVSSIAHYLSDLSVEKVNCFIEDKKFEKYQQDYFPGILSRFRLYNNTKLMQLYFTQYLAEYVEKHYPNIKTASLHPGVVRSDFMRCLPKNPGFKFIFFVFYPLYFLITKKVLYGAQTHLHLCYLPNQELANGGYYSDCTLTTGSKLSRDVKVRKAVIDWSWMLIKRNVEINFEERIVL